MSIYLDRIAAVLDGLPEDATTHDVYDALSDFEPADVQAVLGTRSLSGGGGGGSQDLAQVLAVGGDPESNPITGNLLISADLFVDGEIETGAGTLKIHPIDGTFNLGNAIKTTFYYSDDILTVDFGSADELGIVVHDFETYTDIFKIGPTGAVTVEPSDPAVAGITVANGGIVFPSSDPGVAGAWWDNAGTLTRSSG